MTGLRPPSLPEPKPLSCKRRGLVRDVGGYPRRFLLAPSCYTGAQAYLFPPTNVGVTYFAIEKNRGNKTASSAVNTCEQSFPRRGSRVLDAQDQVRFETLGLSHLADAFNLSRWLLRGGPDAQALAVDEDRRKTLALALESLSPRSREVIVLRELEGTIS